MQPARPTHNSSIKDPAQHSHVAIASTTQISHALQAAVKARAKGTGCPYCSSWRVCRCNSFATHHPNIASQWHADLTRNDGRQPDVFTSRSKHKAWFQFMIPHMSGKHGLRIGPVVQAALNAIHSSALASLQSLMALLQRSTLPLLSNGHPKMTSVPVR